jgi:hypothetical protein
LHLLHTAEFFVIALKKTPATTKWSAAAAAGGKRWMLYNLQFIPTTVLLPSFTLRQQSVIYIYNLKEIKVRPQLN